MTAVPTPADVHDRASDFMAFAPRSSSGIRGRLWTVDPSLMDHRIAAEILAEVPRLIAYATALQATAVERVREGIANEPLPVRDGQPTRLDGNLAHGLAVTEIATIQETSESAAARLLNVSEALCATHLGVLEALESGDIHEHHARTIVDQAGTLPEIVAEPFGLQALGKARTASGRLRTPAEFRRAVRDLREKLHPESIAVRKRAAASERGVWCAPEQDGMMSLTALMPAETGLSMYKRIDSIARAAHRAPAEHRTLPQLRHDVLAYLGLTGTISTSRADTGSQSDEPDQSDHTSRHDNAAQPEAEHTGQRDNIDQFRYADQTRADSVTGIEAADVLGLPDPIDVPEDLISSIKAEIVVHLASSSLPAAHASSDEACTSGTGGVTDPDTAYLEGFGVIDAATARSLAASAPAWRRLWTDSEGTPLRLGRTTYRPPEALRLFLKYRDGTCTFPGCTRPAESAELDHTHEWQDGGATDADNLAHLCRKHHALKSVALVQARQQAAQAAFGTDSQYAEPTGTMIFTTMLGYERTTTPSDRDRLLGIVDDPLAPQTMTVPHAQVPISSGAVKPPAGREEEPPPF
ncbi:DUF222 domain-containing protein [Sinomonas sp. ASV486]|uniref:HNH endonuclease signature motif containing protein n=1 Tax=Sinomonas sp. ASV486 TaxID=3051170 RepID=UPI0027DC07F3|nr:DUF222 domain-containing protein [Sinomonas sp. ASV486]MDQ4488904.1 DUF222 domain-containing protein [Sinomonas sp. ASV486]